MINVWSKVKLGDVLDYEQPTKYIVSSDNYIEKGNIPVLTAGKSFILGYTLDNQGIYDDLPVIIFDDFTTSIKYVDFPFKVKSSAMKILKANKDKADIKFLYYLMSTIYINCEEHKRYWISKFSNIVIPLPPLPTQRKIAAILDKAQALCDIEKQIIQKYDQLAQSVFLEMFGDPVLNPKGWEKFLMEDICKKITDGTHDTPERLRKGVKFITGKHIRPFHIDYDNSDYVTIEVHKEIFKRCNPQKGDVLYTNIGVNLGTAALNSVEYEFSMKNIALLKPKENIVSGYFLEQFLNFEKVKSQILQSASLGGAQQFLSLSQIKKIKVLLPPIDMQKTFMEFLNKLRKQKQLAQQSLQKSEELFQCLMQKAFKGELVA